MARREVRNKLRSDSPEYMQGYSDGMKQAFEESELDAYYAGVGYGKKNAGDKHIGFNNDEERRQFEKGISNKDKHFRAYQAEPISFWERIFGWGSSERAVHSSDNTRSVRRRLKKSSKKRDRKNKREESKKSFKNKASRGRKKTKTKFKSRNKSSKKGRGKNRKK